MTLLQQHPEFLLWGRKFKSGGAGGDAELSNSHLGCQRGSVSIHEEQGSNFPVEINARACSSFFCLGRGEKNHNPPKNF